MNKQLNVNLAFNANTSQAKMQLQELQMQLNNLLKGSSAPDLPLTKSLLEAQNAAAALKVALDSAINVNTGKLDLSKFDASLKKSDLNLRTLRQQMEQLGPAGTKAFLSLSKSIISAETPLIRTNALLTQLWTSLKNTARWQISSSILHGFMSTIQSAYGYAKDLDESLNNIRIVTGKNSEEMARFAEQASQAAKALNTTTTKYTDASLIYYQQGLTNEEVAERAEVTIKLANVSRQSAEIVSDQMTAIWNNFDDGTKKLEYYADAVTALGAATASSSSEIATGLEKFASVAETVGLSYEYATAALATVTATTRQSADVVGTAFKTLFARLNDLKLGETLDDGTTLGQYTENLAKVGVNIKDASGQLKDMDVILEETAAKWKELDKDQQVALAKGVAGIRQYNQFIALMSNWDFMEDNLKIVEESEGTLQKQADTYAESWEAARNRVKAASEDLWDSLLDEKFFIGIANGLEKVIDLFGTFVDSVGGLPGILSVIGVILTKVFSQQLADSLDRMVYNVQSLAGTKATSNQSIKNEAYKEATTIHADSLTEAGAAESQGLQSQVEMQKMLSDHTQRLSKQDQERLKILMDINAQYAEQAVNAAKAVDASREDMSGSNKKLRAKASRSGKVSTEDYAKAKKDMDQMIASGVKAQKTLENVNNKFKSGNIQGYNKQIDSVVSTLRDIGQSKAADNIEKQAKKFKNGEISADTFQKRIQGVIDSEEILDDAVINASDAMASLGDGTVFTTQETDELANKQLNLALNSHTAAEALDKQAQHAEQVKLAIQGTKDAMSSFATNTVKVMQGVGQLSMGINSLIGMFDTLNNKDMSFGQKLLSVTMSLSMAIPALIAGLQILNKEQLKKIKTDVVEIGLGIKKVIVKGQEALATYAKSVADKGETATIWQKVAAYIAEQAAAWPVLVVTLAIVAAIILLVAVAAGLIAAFNAISKAYNADAIAAANAEEAAKNLAAAYEETKSAYEDMISAMDEYQSALDALDELTKGTEEYQAALDEANRAALDLIQNYPQYFKEGDYTWDDGKLILSENAMQEAKSQGRQDVQDAYSASAMASAGAKQARAKADQTQLKRDYRDSNVAAAYGKAVANAAVVSLIPGIGTALAPIAGIVTGLKYTVDQIDEALYGDSVDKAMEVYAEDQNLFSSQAYLADKMAEVGVTNSELIEALWNNRDSLDELGQEFAAAELAMKAAAENVAQNLVSQNDKVQDAVEKGEVDQDDVAAITAKAYEISYKEEQEKALADIKDRGIFNTGTDTSKELMAEYAKISGLDQDSNYKVTNYVGDGTVKIEKTLDDGSVEEVTLTAEEIAATVAAERANDAANKNIETVLADMIKFSDKNATGEQQALKDFLTTGELENISEKDLKDLQKNVIVEGDGTEEGDAEALKETAENLSKTLSGEAKDYGYASWEEMAQELVDAAEETEDAWNNIELPKELKNTEELSLSSARKIQSDVEFLMAGSQGEEGVQTYIEGIEQLTENMDEDQVEAFMNQIGDVDWSSWYAMDDVNAILEEMGIDLNMTTEELNAFTEAMREAGGASPVEMMKKTDELIAGLGTTLAEGIPPGSVLDKETYDQLIEANGDLADSFITNMDGTMQYIGDSELGLEQLDLGKALDEKRAANELYENSKDAAKNIDFEGLSSMDYVFEDEMKEQEKLAENAQDAYDEAVEAAEGLHPIAYQTLEDNKKNAEAALENAEANVEASKKSNLAAQDNLKNGISSVLEDENLLKVAEHNNWDEDRLKEIQEGVAKGDEESIKAAQEFNKQMAMFYEAGDDGTYDFGELEEKIASTATTIEELDALKKQYALSDETYAKSMTGLFYSAANAATSLEELDEIKQKVEDAGGEVNLSVYNENVKRLAEESMNAAESMEDLNKAKQEAADRGVEVDAEVYAENVQRIADANFDSANSFADLSKARQEAEAQGTELDYAGYAENLRRVAEEAYNSAESLDELYAAQEAANAEGVELDYSVFADNLLRLAENYSICADEAKNFEIALQSGNEAVIAEAQAALEATLILGEAAEKYGYDQEELSVQSKQLAKEYGLNAKQAAKLAVENQRMNTGVEELVNNWEDWRKELGKGDKTSRDWAKAAAATTNAIAELVGASEDLELPDTFFDAPENLELIGKAAQGDVDAINELGIVVAQAQVDLMNFQEGMKNADGELIDASQFQTWKDTLTQGLTELQNSIDSLGVGDNVYEKLGGDDWVNALNEMAIATGMSVDQMNSLLNSMGVQAEVEVKSVKQKMTVPTYTEVVEPTNDNLDINGDGEGDGVSGYRRYTIPGEPQEVEGYVQVAQIKASESDIGSPEIKFTGNGTVSQSAQSGGASGGSKKKTSDSRKKKSDMVDRYKEINDEIEETNRLLEKNSTLAEGMWGADKIAKMKESVSLMKQENESLKKKIGLAKQYLAEDKADLQSAAAAAGVGFTFNEDGNINNYTDQMTALWQRRENLLTSFGEHIEDDEQEILDTLDEQIDDLTSAYEQYETTLDEVKDWEQEQLEKELAIQQKNFDILNEELEIKLSINETDMAKIDYYLNKIADDFYQMAEAAALMVGDLSKGVFGGQMGNYMSNLEAQEKYIDDLETQFKNGDINQAQYIEGLQNSQSAIIDNLNSINELDKTMLNYYGDTLAAAGEELAKYTDRMEHQSSVLEHYSSIMEIMGKSKDYTKMGAILKGQATAAEDQMKVAKANYEMYIEQEKARKEELDNAIARGASEAEIEVLKKNWEAASDAADEAQEEMLSKTEAWAEAMKAAVENELNGLAQTLENELTANFGGSFDSLATQMEHANSLQEEYLTTTNKIYETNKMMRTAQQEIDKSTNSVAKKKLKSFINETEQLQNQAKLSKYELDIQQAKYDLLLAEIALEEAQGAKSTVRLQRDNEGNFGYVYTADQNAIAEAEQKFADAQNSLYNIGLEGANQYTEKYQQTLSEFYNTMTELQTQYLNGEFENEQEYQAAMEEAKSFYYAKLQEYSELYTVAIGADARVVQDAWSTEFQTMTYGTEKWKTSIETYIGNVNTAFGTWETVTSRLAEETVGKDLETLEGKVSDITEESKLLVGQITGENGVIKALGAEADAVATTTGKYASMREEIYKLRTEYEQLLEKLNTNINNEHSGNSIGGTGTGDGSSGSSGGSDGSGSGSGSGGGSLNIGDSVTVKSSATTFSRDGGNGVQMQSWVPGSSFSVYGSDDDEVLIGNPGRSGVYTGWVRKADLVGFATGGYTGEWGSYGKLAMLHEKELVLNQKETENFLASMELLDSIVKTIDLYSANAQYGGLLSTPTFGGHNSEPIEQNVHIEAHFPDATDRNEIAEALNTLVNRASQFVSRT